MKTETTHTPGPWTVKMTRKVEVFASSLKLATVEYSEGHEEIDLANARLIAAAPEMLSALKEILAWDKINTSIAINTEGCEAIQHRSLPAFDAVVKALERITASPETGERGFFKVNPEAMGQARAALALAEKVRGK